MIEKFDTSFKNFLYIMGVKNIFIEIVILFFALFILQITNFGVCVDWYIMGIDDGILPGLLVNFAMVCPLGATIFVSYKIWQFWNDLKNGTTR